MHALLTRGAAVVGLALTVVLLGGSVGAAATVPPAPTPARLAVGDLSVSVDLASAQVRDLRGGRCELRVDGTLTFTGTVVGAADGTTTATILAPCALALTTPPGTYPDRFSFDGDFTGEAAGVPVAGPVVYRGLTRTGGTVDATVLLDGFQARAVLRVDALVGVGGTYRGLVTPG